MALVGDTPAQWTAKHVLGHHVDTNIVPGDDDTMYPIKRVLPCLERRWWHKWQHIYIWFLYALVFVPWSTSHQLKIAIPAISAFLAILNKLIHGENGGIDWSIFTDLPIYEGHVRVRLHSWHVWIETLSCIFITNLIRFTPFIFLSSWLNAILISLIFELSSSLWFSLQFAVNHETGSAVKSSYQSIDSPDYRDWGMHQLITSHDYSNGSGLALHLSGGLSMQIAHHLFPSIHYKFYPAMSKIIERTANEFGYPYNVSGTFFSAIQSHYRLLKKMGSNDKLD